MEIARESSERAFSKEFRIQNVALYKGGAIQGEFLANPLMDS